MTASPADIALEPDPGIVEILSFAIDHYFVVVAYTASFLVLAWQTGAVDNQLRVISQSITYTRVDDVAISSSLLFRLVDLASRTLDRCAPSRGHLASRYAVFLRGMANMLQATGPTFSIQNSTADMSGPSNLPSETNGDVYHSWDQDWQDLWQNSGLDQSWLFSNLE
ncbi:MAG: hypothetical protein TREMPRED_005946 [Tremellales sp. Tagirdzhanova-0007]|nr:MAG: hypothetical protein TREMPRED_005946 [Tremellales sp. Tagirdzhanova-0007]